MQGKGGSFERQRLIKITVDVQWIVFDPQPGRKLAGARVGGSAGHVRQRDEAWHVALRANLGATTEPINGQSSGMGVRLFPSDKKVGSATWPVRL